ncbi:MAG TPA: SpoIID/LytB domain-containing protein [Bacillota bacterium]|nr:SpoIID/LytB domain-containing protein [Bacillota bacterium]
MYCYDTRRVYVKLIKKRHQYETTLKIFKTIAVSILLLSFIVPLSTAALDSSSDISEESIAEISDESLTDASDESVETSEDISASVSDISQEASQTVSQSETSGTIVTADDYYVRVGIFIGSEAASKYIISSETGFEYGYSEDVYFTKVSETSKTKLTVVSSGTGTVQLYDSSGKFIYEYTENAGRAIAIRALDYEVLTPVSPKKNSTRTYSYEGYFEFPRVSSTSGSAMRMINVVELETYVLCVLPCEISTSAPVEAMKAQAMCIRSLVMSEGSSKKHLDCNICSDSDCQVYYGTWGIDGTRDYSTVKYNNLVRAVEETAGEYMIYVGPEEDLYGIIVQAAFHSSSGGSTVSAKSFWGSTSAPYCTAARVPEETNYYTWGCSVVTLDEIYKATKLDDFKNSTTAWKKEVYKLGKIASLDIVELEKNSDHVVKLKITDVNGYEVLLTRGDRVYYFIHRVILCCETYDTPDAEVTILSSSNFTLTSINSTALDVRVQTGTGDGEISSADPVSVITSGGTTEYTMPGGTTVITANGIENANLTSDAAGYKLVGKGWGHCVGLGQKGAADLAKAGYDYAEILDRYFSNIDIVSIKETGYEFSYDN